MTKRKKEQRRRKVTAFLLALCMVWLMLPPGEARAATPQPEAEVQQTYVDDSTDINAIYGYNHSEDYIDNMTICDGCRAVIQANAGRYSS